MDVVVTGAEPEAWVIAVVALVAGMIRGFTGFGGPAFMLAILTLFFPPVSVVAKVLVVDFLTSVYLFKTCWRDIRWKPLLWMTIPTLLVLPFGHWLLVELDPSVMKRAMAGAIALSCVAMLIGWRYKTPMNIVALVAVGVVAGVVFGGAYIALFAVVPVLLGPYDKNEGRALIVAWSFLAVIGFALLSGGTGTTTWSDVNVALPGIATYWLGAWIGSAGFRQSSEKLFRRAAIATLLVLSLGNLLL